jgi:hypothetical protein
MTVQIINEPNGKCFYKGPNIYMQIPSFSSLDEFGNIYNIIYNKCIESELYTVVIVCLILNPISRPKMTKLVLFLEKRNKKCRVYVCLVDSEIVNWLINKCNRILSVEINKFSRIELRFSISHDTATNVCSRLSITDPFAINLLTAIPGYVSFDISELILVNKIPFIYEATLVNNFICYGPSFDLRSFEIDETDHKNDKQQSSVTFYKYKVTFRPSSRAEKDVIFMFS